MSLAVAAWRDMILMIIQDRDYIAFKNQTAKVSGRGLNLKHRKECADRAEENFIDRCEVLEEGDIKAEAMLEAQPGQMFVPNKKAKHKVPEVLSNNNPTQKRKTTNANSKTQNNNIGKKGMKTKNTRKRPRIEISDSDDDTDSDDDVFGTVPKDVEEQKLVTNPPHIVLINLSIQKCSRCDIKFTAPERW